MGTIAFAGRQHDELRQRLERVFADQLTARFSSDLPRMLCSRAGEIVRDRFARELRSSLRGATTSDLSERGWLEKRFGDRLANATTEQLTSAVYDASRTIGDRVVEAFRDAVVGTMYANDERAERRIREYLEPEITARIVAGLRDGDMIAVQVERALQERFRDRLQRALTARHEGIDHDELVQLLHDDAAVPVAELVVERLAGWMRAVVRDRIAEVMRSRIDEVVTSTVRGTWTPESTSSPARDADVLTARMHDALLEQVGEAMRERLWRTIRADFDQVLRDRLGLLVRTTLAEQRILGYYDPEEVADAVRSRLTADMRTILADTIREHICELGREPMRDAIRSVVLSARPTPVTGNGHSLRATF